MSQAEFVYCRSYVPTQFFTTQMIWRLIQRLVLSLCILTGANILSAAEKTFVQDTASTIENNPQHTFGWVPKELVPQELVQQLVPQVCRGAYLQFENDDKDIEPGLLYITGDSAKNSRDNIIELDGSVKAYQLGTQIFADMAKIDNQAGFVEMQGRVRVYHKGLHFFGDTLWLDSNSGEMRLDNVDFIFPETRQRFQISLLSRDEDGVFHLVNGRYTTCEPEENTWSIFGADIELDYNEGWGTVVHAVLYTNNIPVFYFPWFRFPLDDRRHTGILLPEFGYSDESGWYYIQPIYLNLAPDYDATLYPGVFTERGILADADARLLTAYTNNQAVASGINDKKSETWRSRTGLYHTGGINLPFRSRVDYTRVNDPLYFKDFQLSLVGSNNHFIDQLADIQTSWNAFDFRLGSYEIQPIGETSTISYARLPEVEINFNNRFGIFILDFASQYSHFQPRRLIDFSASEIRSGETVSAKRQHNRVNIGVSFDRTYGFIKSAVELYATNYQLEDQIPSVDEHQSRYTQSSKLDLGVFFDRFVNFNQVTYQQTLEPRLFFSQSGYVNQNDIPLFGTNEPVFTYDSLFHTNRFQGIDRIGDARDVSLSITSALKDDKGYEFFRIGVGQKYYGSPRLVTLNRHDDTTQESLKYTRTTSPIASRSQLNLGSKTNLRSDYVFDQEEGRSLLNRWNAQHRWNARTIYNIGYNYLYNDVSADIANEQAYVSGVTQITPFWAMFGRFYYDIADKYAQETLFGLEYDACCWRFRTGAFQKLASANDDTPSNGVFFQFQFKGLSGSQFSAGESYDSNLTEALGQAIPGFSDRRLYVPD